MSSYIIHIALYILETETENSQLFELCTRDSRAANRKGNALSSTTSLFHAAYTVLCHGQCCMLLNWAVFRNTSSAVQDVGTRNRTVVYMYNVHFAIRA